MEEIRQIMSEAPDKTFDKPTEQIGQTRQRSARLEQESRQPRLAKEAYVKSDTTTCKRMENVPADRVISGNSSSAQVDPDPMCLTSFGDNSTEPLTLPYSRDDALVDKALKCQSVSLTCGDAHANRRR